MGKGKEQKNMFSGLSDEDEDDEETEEIKI